MSYQIVKKGGSVCMVDRNRNQPERYIGAIEPYTTKERLHQIQAFNKSIPNNLRPMKVMAEFGMIPTKSIHKVPEKQQKKKEDKSFFKTKTKRIQKRSSYPVPKLQSDVPHTQRMMERHKERKKEKQKALKAYRIGELTKVQELEAEKSILKGNLQLNERQREKFEDFDSEERKALRQEQKDIHHEMAIRRKKIRKILGKDYRSGRGVAQAAKKGEVVILD
ncbi:MAG: hypothetical protein ACKVE3_07000 [Dissulfuribacterales bacterium]